MALGSSWSCHLVIINSNPSFLITKTSAAAAAASLKLSFLRYTNGGKLFGFRNRDNRSFQRRRIGFLLRAHLTNHFSSTIGLDSKRGEALMLFDHFKGLGIKANSTTYALLIDAHLIARDQKSALCVIEDMVLSGFAPTREILKKVRRRCVREMDTESDKLMNALAKRFGINMRSEKRSNTLFELDYTRVR